MRQPLLEELAQHDSPPSGMPHGVPGLDMGDISAHDVALGHLNARGYIQFHPLLAQRLNNYKAAIFLGHALAWSRYLAQAQPHRRGWFFMSAAQWREATGLSTHEQAAARGELVQRGLLEDALAGRPAILHYRVNLQATATFLGLDQLTWNSVGELFRSCIRFYKPLSDVCGSVTAGLYLSYLLQRQSFSLRNPVSESATVELFPGEFSYRPDHARIALCLGIKAQRNAREKLKLAGFIREGRASNDVVATRVNLSAIAACLQAQDRPARKRVVRKAATTMALVQASTPASTPAPKPAKPAKSTGYTGSLTRSTLPLRQLNLFAAMGLANRQALDAAHVGEPAPTHSGDPLVQTLFAANLFGRNCHVDEAAPTPVPSVPATSELSTGVAPPADEFALFENPICPFLNANLPFFKNYKDKGISKVFTNTTTTPPVDKSARDADGRRRVKNSENPESGTAVDQKIDANGVIQADGGVFESSQGVGCDDGEKSLVGPEIQSDASEAESDDSFVELILSERLNPACHAGVLATVAKAPPELRQAFLDELAGHLLIPNKTIHNPVGWLHSLIRRHQDGFVTLALATHMATQRARYQRHLERIANTPPAAPSSSSEQSSAKPEQVAVESEVQRTERQRLKELRASFGVKRGDAS